ncbi:uncharacterized protein LOC111034934, partial [Myzus persicae]|uniref:uncharacterized protein LOC111030379 n=1 Tax=Myzus persicae TaxID=13164 RepID=UPI000B9313F2
HQRLSSLADAPALASIATTAVVARPRHNYHNHGLRQFQDFKIPMFPYFWSAPRSSPHRGNNCYRGLGSVTATKRNHQQLFSESIPKKTRKIVIDGPGRHEYMTSLSHLSDL